MPLPQNTDWKKRATEWLSRQGILPQDKDARKVLVAELAVLIRDATAEGMQHVFGQVRTALVDFRQACIAWQLSQVKNWNIPDQRQPDAEETNPEIWWGEKA